MPKSGRIERKHDHSLVPKLAFSTLHASLVALCLWLAFGSFDWADQDRAQVLAVCAVLYFLRHVFTLALIGATVKTAALFWTSTSRASARLQTSQDRASAAATLLPAMAIPPVGVARRGAFLRFGPVQQGPLPGSACHPR